MVLLRGFEPPRLSAQTSQACVFTNYTTVALPFHFNTTKLVDKLSEVVIVNL